MDMRGYSIFNDFTIESAIEFLDEGNTMLLFESERVATLFLVLFEYFKVQDCFAYESSSEMSLGYTFDDGKTFPCIYHLSSTEFDDILLLKETSLIPIIQARHRHKVYNVFGEIREYILYKFPSAIKASYSHRIEIELPQKIGYGKFEKWFLVIDAGIISIKTLKNNSDDDKDLDSDDEYLEYFVLNWKENCEYISTELNKYEYLYNFKLDYLYGYE